jgi:Family of unknown function (DUF6011)
MADKPKKEKLFVHCKVCGRILMSKKSIMLGVGKVCKAKTIDSYKKLEASGQLKMFD